MSWQKSVDDKYRRWVWGKDERQWLNGTLAQNGYSRTQSN